MTDVNIYLAVAINGAVTGFGVAIGTYFANSHFIKRLEILENKMKVRNASQPGVEPKQWN